MSSAVPTIPPISTVDTAEDLEALSHGTVIADRDHDAWFRVPGGWTHDDGPILRSETLMPLFGPVTVVLRAMEGD